MKFILYSTATCVLKEIIEIPGETPEDIEDNFFDDNYEVIDGRTVVSIDDDNIFLESLHTLSDEEVWLEGLAFDNDVVRDNM